MEVDMNMICTHVLEKCKWILILAKLEEVVGKQKLFDWFPQGPIPEFDNSLQDNICNFTHKIRKHKNKQLISMTNYSLNHNLKTPRNQYQE